MEELKIKQIIPAPDNLYVIYQDKNGRFESKVVCLALLSNDEVVMMDSDDGGNIGIAEGVVRVLYK